MQFLLSRSGEISLEAKLQEKEMVISPKYYL
jgi:hypothetical protein